MNELQMDDGWELVPKEEVDAAHGGTMKGWQFLIPGDNIWFRSGVVNRSEIYRRPKSKPEQYGWLRAGCGVEMPCNDHFEVKLENGQKGMVSRINYGAPYKWASSGIPIASPIAFWHRTAPAPDDVKDSACRAEFLKYDKSRTDMPNFDTWKAAWQACEEHHEKGAK